MRACDIPAWWWESNDPEIQELISIVKQAERDAYEACYVERIPTRPRPAQPWELRSQVASSAPITAWQRCPERHRARESKQRWQREGA